MRAVSYPDEPYGACLSDQRLGLPAFLRVAVLCRMPHQGPRWDSAATCALADGMVADGLTHFDYFPIDFSDPQSGESITAGFARIAASLKGTASEQMVGAGGAGESSWSGLGTQRRQISCEQPFDAVVIVGGADIDSDISLVHRTLAPCMQAVPVPVLCALGADDAETILGDSAWRVFPDPQRLLECIATAIRPPGLPAEAILAQIHSLAQFLLTELTIETHILRDAAILPALHTHLARHEEAFAAAETCHRRAVDALQKRLLEESGRLEQNRARLGVEMARAQRHGKSHKHQRMQWLRVGMLLAFASLTVMLWWWTSPATTVFFSGCALVLLSAAYVGIGNFIADHPT